MGFGGKARVAIEAAKAAEAAEVTEVMLLAKLFWSQFQENGCARSPPPQNLLERAVTLPVLNNSH